MMAQQLNSMRSLMIRIVLGLTIAAGGAILANYTPLHDITLVGGQVSLSGLLTSIAALLSLALHTIAFGIIARREAIEDRPVSFGLWVLFFLIAIIVAFAIGMRFTADELRSFSGNGVLPQVAEALNLFDEPLSHSLLLVGWMVLLTLTVLMELRIPPTMQLPRKDRNIAIAGGLIAGAIGGLGVVEGQVWWIALPASVVLAAVLLYKIHQHSSSFWQLPATLFTIFGFLALATFVSSWGLLHQGFPEIREQPFRFFEELDRDDLQQFQKQLDAARERFLR